jgi:hypothetical protein
MHQTNNNYTYPNTNANANIKKNEFNPYNPYNLKIDVKLANNDFLTPDEKYIPKAICRLHVKPMIQLEREKEKEKENMITNNHDNIDGVIDNINNDDINEETHKKCMRKTSKIFIIGCVFMFLASFYSNNKLYYVYNFFSIKNKK